MNLRLVPAISWASLVLATGGSMTHVWLRNKPVLPGHADELVVPLVRPEGGKESHPTPPEGTNDETGIHKPEFTRREQKSPGTAEPNAGTESPAVRVAGNDAVLTTPTRRGSTSEDAAGGPRTKPTLAQIKAWASELESAAKGQPPN